MNTIFRYKVSQFQEDLHRLIEKIEEKFRLNNVYLEMARGNDKKDSAHFRQSYNKCGAPFFKDAHSESAPINEDYRYRRNILKEFFPFDQPKTKTKWKTSEKVKLIEGVKSQMVNHIVSEQSKKVCVDARKTRGTLQKLKFISNNSDLKEASITSIHKTIKENYPNFQINWNLISFNDLNSNHSVTECMGMWFSSLNPDLNREPFTDEEDNLILQALSEDSYETWQEISERLNNRSALQTFIRYTTTYVKHCPAGVRWTQEEDETLMDLIAKYSIDTSINWTKIGQEFPLRSKLQCYNRYLTLRKSAGKKGAFSAKEDKVILDFVNKYGEDYFCNAKIPTNIIPGRSMTQIRTHFMCSLRNSGKFLPWTKEEDRQLVEFVNQNGFDWSKIAKELKTHSRISCRTRYQTIKKYLDKNPNQTVDDVPIKYKSVGIIKKFEKINSGEVEDLEIDDQDEKPKRESNVSKLQRMNFELYKMLLTCFNLDFTKRDLKIDDQKTLVLMNLFDIPKKYLATKRTYLFTKDQLKIIENLKTLEINENLKNEIEIIKSNTDFKMPPNYNSSIGLRAVYIKVQNRESNENREENEENVDQKALENFRKKFFSLFYWTAVMSRMRYDQLKEISYIKNSKQSLPSREVLEINLQRKATIVSKNLMKALKPSKN